MTQKDYLKYLISESKKFIKQYNLFDIVLYGSSVKGKIESKDVDLLLIFREEALKERVDITYKLKEILKEKIKNLDIKTINLTEFFKSDFLARQNILIEGYSLLDEKDFSERIGFKGYSLFKYSLTNLNHNKKTKFIYALIGRNNPGMIKRLKAESIGKGAVMIPIGNSIYFQDFLDSWNIKYTKKNILVSQI